jgi:hypothetical protein
MAQDSECIRRHDLVIPDRSRKRMRDLCGATIPIRYG